MKAPRRRRFKIALSAAGFVVALLVGAFLYARYGTDNFHVTELNRWYRSAQMDPGTLESTVRKHEVKTVLALRGHNADDDEWYAPELEATQRAGAVHVVAKLPSSRLPWRSELSALFEALDGVQEPVLVHCKAGSDRTGLVTAIWLHDYAGVPLEKAKGQLDFLPYMHFRYGSASPMHEFLDLYKAWIDGHEEMLNIRDWVKLHYFEEKSGREGQPWYDGVTYKPEGKK